MSNLPDWTLLHKDKINIFFAGSGFKYDFAYDLGVRKRLLSWHANTTKELEEYCDKVAEKRSFGIVDSGAFTIWNKGGSIDVNEYGNKLVKLLTHFDIGANLDVIPGEQGMRPGDITPEITETAARKGWSNFIYLQGLLADNGIDPQRVMPIYHQGEHPRWLDKMIDHGCGYIGISPSNDYKVKQRMIWLDDVFTQLPNTVKSHGYAVTSPDIMQTYPWFSVDSSSWIMAGAQGFIWSPYGYVTLTKRGWGQTAKSINAWDERQKKKFADYFADLGFTIEQLQDDYKKRWVVNAHFFLAYEKSYQCKPKPRETSLFEPVGTPAPSAKGKDKPLGEVHMVLHDATQ
jgi:hypothetical protein